MDDITICVSSECKRKEECLRYETDTRNDMQSYADLYDGRKGKRKKCAYFIGRNK